MRRFLPLVLILALLTGCAAAPADPTTEAISTPPVTTEPPAETAAPPDAASIAVETPCGTLYLPDQWDIPLIQETSLGDPMVIRFLAEDTALYALTFSSAPGPNDAGMVRVDGEAVYVGLELAALEHGSDLLLSMQESVNLLLEQLPLEPVAPPSGPVVEGEDLLILTPYGSLHFPRSWEECLMTAQPDDGTLAFYCQLPDRDPVLLFTVRFGSDSGDICASITGPDGTVTQLSLDPAVPVFDASWTQGEMDLVHAMQEDMNHLLLALS